MEKEHINLKQPSLPINGISLLVLFGSHAKGLARNSSDIDVAALAKQPLMLSERARLTDWLAQELKVSEDRIDLVDLRDAPPLLQYQVAQTGKLIAGSLPDFVRFRVLAWKRYVDTARFRRLRHQALDSWFLDHTQKS